MLKLKRKSGLGRLLQLRRTREARILIRYALYALAMASLEKYRDNWEFVINYETGRL